MIGLAAVGIDPLALLGLVTTFIVGFAFMIGGASSDYFRGLLFILVQRPVSLIFVLVACRLANGWECVL